MKILVTLFFLLVFQSATAQKFYVTADKMNILYRGVDNPLTIIVQNCFCNSLIVKTDVGKITGTGCSYIFYSDTGFIAKINLYRKAKGKLQQIGTTTFRIKKVPNPLAKVGPSSGGRIQKIVLSAQQYIRAGYEEDETVTRIDSFSVVVMRGDTCLFKRIDIIGNKFSNELSEILKLLTSGDSVTFKNIYATRKEETLVLEPFTLYVY